MTEPYETLIIDVPATMTYKLVLDEGRYKVTEATVERLIIGDGRVYEDNGSSDEVADADVAVQALDNLDARYRAGEWITVVRE